MTYSNSYIHSWRWLPCKVPTSTLGPLWGSVSCTRTLPRAGQENWTSDLYLGWFWFPELFIISLPTTESYLTAFVWDLGTLVVKQTPYQCQDSGITLQLPQKTQDSFVQTSPRPLHSITPSHPPRSGQKCTVNYVINWAEWHIYEYLFMGLIKTDMCWK